MKYFLCILLLVSEALAVSDPNPGYNGPSDVTLELYTQGNPKVAEYITMDDDSKSHSFNPKNPTRVVIHGMTSNARNLEAYRDAFIQTGTEYNIVLVDWERPASGDLESAHANAIPVGDYVGKVLTHLLHNRGLDPDTVVIIGHSSGGIVAGVAGNRFGGGVASEIIALDPATGSEESPMEDQLDKSDAKFVQIIYTNYGKTGSQKWLAHVFFYPNGGTYQSGCSDEEDVDGCCHNRAPLYFIESIHSTKFIATSCSSYDSYALGLCSLNEHAIMGDRAPRNLSGSYFLKTNAKAPFAQGRTAL